MAELHKDLDQDPTGKICSKYCEADVNCNFASAVYQQLCSLRFYMVPQFMMMRSFGLNDTHLAIICLQAFSAFGVFMMRQFYQGIPDELCEAARIDGMSEYQIYAKIMLPLAKPALSTLTIFTFVNTWNDFLGPLIYLKTESKKTLQIGLRMFIGQNSSEYGLIMAASVLSLIPVLVVFLALQKYFVEGIAATGVKG